MLSSLFSLFEQHVSTRLCILLVLPVINRTSHFTRPVVPHPVRYLHLFLYFIRYLFQRIPAAVLLHCCVFVCVFSIVVKLIFPDVISAVCMCDFFFLLGV